MHGFKAVGTEMAMIINFPTELYNYKEPDEYRVPWDYAGDPLRLEAEERLMRLLATAKIP